MLKSRDAGGGHVAHGRVTALGVTVLTKAAATLSNVPTRTRGRAAATVDTRSRSRGAGPRLTAQPTRVIFDRDDSGDESDGRAANAGV